MTLLQQLHRWRCNLLQRGETPTFIPLTAEELTVLVSDCPRAPWAYTPAEHFMVASPPKVFGHEVFSTEFAENMRKRQISVPVTQLEESVDISWYKAWVEDDIPGSRLKYRLTARICSDTTRLTLTFEWDSLAAFKRFFKLTRWFPVRTKTARIDARVLYPYIKVSLPHNRSHTTFQHVP